MRLGLPGPGPACALVSLHLRCSARASGLSLESFQDSPHLPILPSPSLPCPTRVLALHRPSPVPPTAGTASSLSRPLAFSASGFVALVLGLHSSYAPLLSLLVYLSSSAPTTTSATLVSALVSNASPRLTPSMSQCPCKRAFNGVLSGLITPSHFALTLTASSRAHQSAALPRSHATRHWHCTTSLSACIRV